ncbi:MAG: helix-hairpin-helix domain-containing protein [Candidatus Riflebacteria bacterium]|nr:helix-hairpin-helix domain-containing protein [Candidatus Riflebacteria bacterium]
MVLTRLEKITFGALVMLLGLGIFLLIGKVGVVRNKNQQLIAKIQEVSVLTDHTVLVKSEYYNKEEEAGKLNLNRTDLKSIGALPGMTPALANRIYEFVQQRGQIKDMKELLGVKGFTKKRLRHLENYATAVGGHSGQAAWGDKLNLNFASIDDVKALPGVGKKLAEKIVEFRNRNGGFFSLEDLKEVPGLTEKTIKKFIDKVEVK